MGASEADWTRHLVDIVQDNSQFMSNLQAVRQLALSHWCIGAGAIRNLVWDKLHDKAVSSPLADVDVAYFDPSDLSRCRDQALQQQLLGIDPAVPWEVTNQAGVHEWFEAYFGHAVAPLGSLHEAVASWPEFATSVGVSLDRDDTIQVIAPHGLSDLFAMTIRRNPARVSVETYRRRVEQKRYAERWPNVQIVL